MKLQETRENVVAEQHEKGKAFAEEMRSLMEEVRATHPFAKMSEKEILAKLRETREIVASERHEKRTNVNTD